MFIPTTSQHPQPTEYSTVRSGQEMDLAPVIVMIFMCYKFCLYFSGLSWRSPDHLDPPQVTPASIVPTRATNKVRNLNVLQCSNA